jgi:hypothetical protein
MSHTESITDAPLRLPMTRQPLPRWIQVTVLLVVFVAGGVAGATIATTVLHSRMETYRQQAPIFSEDIVSRLRVRLNLSDQQAAEVREIVERRHVHMIELRRSGSRSMHDEFTEMENEIAGVLDKQQAAAWHQIADFVRQRFLPPIYGESSESRQ